ncbi:MAG: DUF4870 domain-containing protein [Cyclobacteriaceae bacterium]|nr:DUF4870 domain-containing protein [Cyclobacteriaceae bacterium]
MQEKQWALICHLSGLCGYFIPFGNLIVPIIIWSMKKDEMPMVDAHGKEVINFQISFTIWVTIAIVFVFILIGIPILIALIILQVIFIIIATIKADSGELYHYPLTIRFIK